MPNKNPFKDITKKTEPTEGKVLSPDQGKVSKGNPFTEVSKSPKNEVIPQDKAMVKVPEETLILEARKYKSAEEFEKLFEYH